MSRSYLRLSYETWREIFPHAPEAILQAFTDNPAPLNDAGITETHIRLGYALANVEHECRGFAIKNLTENINYSAAGMAKTWPKRFSSASAVQARYGTARGWQIKAIDDIYGNRMGNRPNTSDGSRYIGRGGPQITGRGGYREVGRRTGLDLVNTPELATFPENQPSILAAFWSWKNLNTYADLGDFKQCVEKWNGGFNGFADRKSHLRQNDLVIRRLNFVSKLAKIIPGST